MNELSRRIFLSCAVLLLSTCVFASLISIGIGAVVLVDQINGTASETQAPLIDSPPVETSTQTSPTENPPTGSTPQPATTDPESTEDVQSSGEELTKEILDQMDLIEQQVIELRGLNPAEDVTRSFYTPDELRQVVIDDFFGDYSVEEAASDTIVLWAFGLIERDANLLDIYVDLYSEGIAGFYDDETGEMAIVVGDGFGGAEQITYAHEYTHALQDQTYDLSDGLGYNEETCENDAERCAALQALIEGDATQSELEWLFEYATEEQFRQLLEFYDTYESPAFDNSPPFLQEDLLFPYTLGQEFVLKLIEQGGWESVDAAYSDPPVSTEQILHPERYPQDEPILVVLPDLAPVLGSDWSLLEEDVMGEWYIFMILAKSINGSAQLSEFEAQIAAEGWGGDSYAVYQHVQDESVVMVLKNIWDTREDATEFVGAFERYATRRFGSPIDQSSGEIAWESTEGYSIIHFEGDQTVWILAPDASTAATVWEALQNP